MNPTRAPVTTLTDNMQKSAGLNSNAVFVTIPVIVIEEICKKWTFLKKKSQYCPRKKGDADGGRGDSATTEGVLSSMWRKITNFFTSAEGSTSVPGSENYTARYAEVNDRPARMVRPETRRGNVHHDYRRREAYRRDIQGDEGKKNHTLDFITKSH
ncbi:hypothetical protein CEXT_458051 [Caerostris extrusa]|uniref:Uncharacterized protein n=1 Tax=Caerostris extrusa TaxID=172846 RepID=A0AAV4WWU4_CAEEX|nr:hypothetical protein CEXT_458051 [Caerostris extrusa]